MTVEERPASTETDRNSEHERLIAEAERRKARNPRGPRLVGEFDDEWHQQYLDSRSRSFLAKLGQQKPSTFDDGPEDDADTRQTPAERERLSDHVREVAWRNSLAAASLTALGSHRLEALDPSQFPDQLRAYVDGLPAGGTLNLAMFGGVGSGKTAAAVALGSYAASSGMMVRIVRHADYIAWLRPEGAGPDLPPYKVRDRFSRDADLLILDDVAAGLDPTKEASRHVLDETLQLLDKRIGRGKGTVITTNEFPETLEKILGERIISRLQDRGRGLIIEHPDRRRNGWF